jgi:CHAD domain-containing protein
MGDKNYGCCEDCRYYLREAGVAIRRHLQAVTALEAAVRENEIDRFAALADAMQEAGMARENAVTRYTSHAAAHRMQKSISASGGS